MKKEVRFTNGKMIAKLATVLDTTTNTLEIKVKDSIVTIKINKDGTVSVL